MFIILHQIDQSIDPPPRIIIPNSLSLSLVLFEIHHDIFTAYCTNESLRKSP